MARDVLAVAARNGNEALFEQYVSAMRKVHSPEQYYNLARALAEFRDPKIIDSVLKMATSDEVRNQDAAGLIAFALSNVTNQKIVWEWIKTNLPAVEKKTTMSSGPQIVNATRTFCSAEMRDDVQSFFTEHKVPSAERSLKQALEDIEACTRRRPRLQTELAEWLQQHQGTSATGTR
jgi:aminopeptidase N/puromycin-sensitive aminopeptidase